MALNVGFVVDEVPLREIRFSFISYHSITTSFSFTHHEGRETHYSRQFHTDTGLLQHDNKDNISIIYLRPVCCKYSLRAENKQKIRAVSENSYLLLHLLMGRYFIYDKINIKLPKQFKCYVFIPTSQRKHLAN